MTMTSKKRKALTAAGWRVGDAPVPWETVRAVADPDSA